MLFRKKSRSWPGLLVSGGWLRSRLGDKNLRVLDVREYFGQAIAGYPWGHIPGALSASPEAFFTIGGVERRLLPREVLEKSLRTLGLGENVSIVVYDETTGTSATLACWAFLAMGFERVGVLDGGWQGWVQRGYPVEKKLPQFPRPAFSPTASGEGLIVDTGYVLSGIKRGNVQLLDARTPAEFSSGHIPGAVLWPWHENLLRDEASEWLKPREGIREKAESLGLSHEKEVICHCNTGVQASHLCFVLKLLGYQNVRLYTGSWRVWKTESAGERQTASRSL